MNLYFLSQKPKGFYDVYYSMVVVAENEEDAVGLSMVESSMLEKEWGHMPDMPFNKVWRNYGYYYRLREDSWTSNPNCRLIAKDVQEPEGVLCADYNAG